MNIEEWVTCSFSFIINTAEYYQIKKGVNEDNNAYFRVIETYNQYALFEEISIKNNTMKVYLYDFNKDEFRIIIPTYYSSLSHSVKQAVFVDDGIIMTIPETETLHKTLGYYSLQENSLKIIDDRNCSDVMMVKGHCYYLLIEEDKCKIMEYDIVNQQKIEHYQLEVDEKSQSIPLYELISNGNDILLARSNYSFYNINLDTKEIEYFLNSNYCSDNVYQKHYLKFTTNSGNSKRPGFQDYLYDLEQEIYYENNGGNIYLSNTGMVWIETKIDVNNIPKGEILNSKYSHLRYLKY